MVMQDNYKTVEPFFNKEELVILYSKYNKTQICDMKNIRWEELLHWMKEMI